ncbi:MULTISPECIES: mycofactocin-coupled SDR family oxidoreductase [Streptomyces]|uniref:mycofactocin-coupled SDR family oxidoreductase n=1 Tax=Streptomyces TaxID=1883 RepID=UPI002253EC6C|nr:MULTISPECIES: mycofactocin-coupled SDR family oxidoreductase [Streptomyces]MCX5059099.1 mycofactocin-coupled SDR family oxidoreductase [Streptomyces sp. NBC_00452]MCZ4513042.1 mycofactocin-coupled SDR family oxidoreductase [Streptomyces sp. ActVer]WSS99393.1 mycofactocin-coupled SDR family oxidoreductase [Streptomyces phaeochromogenes]
MTGRVTGKVALITGAARGQGRSHAVQLAREGADIIAVDYLTSFDTISYPMATQEDQQQTVKEVEALGRRILTIQADVRDGAAMRKAVADGVAEFGKIDVVVANAGICAMTKDQPLQAWVDVSGVDFGGVLNTLNAAIPHLGAGASLVVTGSLAALVKGGPSKEPGGVAYAWAKRSLVSLVHDLALVLAPHSIRLNGVHPTNCNTDMLHHEAMYQTFRPDLEHPTREDATEAFPVMQAIPVPWVEPSDVSQVIVFLASDESRYITGQFINCDAGGHLKI